MGYFWWIRQGLAAFVVGLALIGGMACGDSAPTVVPTQTSASTVQPARTPEPTLTATAFPTPTLPPTVTATLPPAPTRTTIPTVTPTPISTATATPTPTATPVLDPVYPEAFLNQIPDDERSCLLFDLDQEHVDGIFAMQHRATSEETETIERCISVDTVTRLYLGFVEWGLIEPFELAAETAACIAEHVRYEDNSRILSAFDIVRIDRRPTWSSQKTLADVVQPILWSTLSCFNKNEWIAASSQLDLEVGDVELVTLRCMLEELGPEEFYDMVIADRGRTPGLSSFTAARDCGVDLAELLGARPHPIPTPVPTAAPAPPAAPAPTAAAPAQPAPTVPAAAPAADFEFDEVLQGPDGFERYPRLSYLRGTPLVLFFWYAGCPPCGPSMALIDAEYRTYGWSGFPVIAVQLPLDPDRGREEVRASGVTIPVVYTDDQGAYDRFGLDGVPTTILLDGNHREVARWAGTLTGSFLSEIIERIGGQGALREPPSTPTPAPTVVPSWWRPAGWDEFRAQCSNGITVPQPASNSELVDDCAVLLSFRDELAGSATLNWGPNSPIGTWDGVGMIELVDPDTARAYARVGAIILTDRGLSGRLPRDVGLLAELTDLHLRGNDLSGHVPDEWSNLTRLRVLTIGLNDVTGCLPESFRNVRLDIDTLPFCAPAAAGPTLRGLLSVDTSFLSHWLSRAVVEQFVSNHPEVNIGQQIARPVRGFSRLASGQVDVVVADRAIEEVERESAAVNGRELLEFQVAWFALAAAVHGESDFVTCLTTDELTAIWESGRAVQRWSQLREGWPDEEISLYGPSPGSRSFQAFAEGVVGHKDPRGDYTGSSDPVAIFVGISQERYALGILDYSSTYDPRVLVEIDNGAGCVAPTEETIAGGTYSPLSWPLFLYVSTDALIRSEVVEFVDFYLRFAAEVAPDLWYTQLSNDQLEVTLETLSELRKGQ